MRTQYANRNAAATCACDDLLHIRTAQPQKSTAAPIGIIAGSVVGGVLLLAVVALALWYKKCLCARKPSAVFKPVSVAHTASDNSSSSRRSSGRSSGSSMLISLDSESALDSAYVTADSWNSKQLDNCSNNTTIAKKATTMTRSAASADNSQVAATDSVVTFDDDDVVTQQLTAANSAENSKRTVITTSAENSRRTVAIGATQMSCFMSKSIVSAAETAKTAHLDIAWEALGSVAQYIPYVKNIYGLCDEIVQLFGTGTTISANCAEVIAWAEHMKVLLLL
jgi:hypothetical protein